MVMKYLMAVLVLLVGITAVAGDRLVVINEVEINPLGNAPPWVELYNNGPDDVDISGWEISITESYWAGCLPIPAGTIIPANEFYVQEGSPVWVHPTSATVELWTDEDVVVDATHLLIDVAGGSVAWSRYPDGCDNDTAEDWIYVKSTKGGPNQPRK
jgi:hypothetical protein